MLEIQDGGRQTGNTFFFAPKQRRNGIPTVYVFVDYFRWCSYRPPPKMKDGGHQTGDSNNFVKHSIQQTPNQKYSCTSVN
jgi:hypothetical protein